MTLSTLCAKFQLVLGRGCLGNPEDPGGYDHLPGVAMEVLCLLEQ